MLRYVLKVNAASCALFGILFLFTTASAGAIIGDPPTLLLQVLGGGLIINAVLLFGTSLKQQPMRAAVLFFALGDALWVVATLTLIAMSLWITTPLGIILSLGVAAFVGLCGAMQWKLAPPNI